MYILVKPDQSTVYPYSVNQLMKDNPHTSFRTDMSDSELAQWGVYPVTRTSSSWCDERCQKIVEDVPTLVGNEWTQVWRIQDLSELEIQELNNNRQITINAEKREFLASTDWYVIRKSETGISIPEEILVARSEARAAIIEA